MSRVLSFDIGIKNLAYCVLDRGNRICAWENVNLLPSVDPILCEVCHKLKAGFSVMSKSYCKRHVPKTHIILPELSKKIPNKRLKELVREHSCTIRGVSNEKCMESLSEKFALPIKQPKQESAATLSLERIHDALRSFVSERWRNFSGCTDVLLENQPAFKNPHMKSVQVLLFAVLREAFLSHQEAPHYKLVHAKKKVKDAVKGDAGYAERKNKSEERVCSLFDTNTLHCEVPAIMQSWTEAKKKSDMADALCMCVDHCASN